MSTNNLLSIVVLQLGIILYILAQILIAVKA